MTMKVNDATHPYYIKLKKITFGFTYKTIAISYHLKNQDIYG